MSLKKKGSNKSEARARRAVMCARMKVIVGSFHTYEFLLENQIDYKIVEVKKRKIRKREKVKNRKAKKRNWIRDAVYKRSELLVELVQYSRLWHKLIFSSLNNKNKG